MSQSRDFSLPSRRALRQQGQLTPLEESTAQSDAAHSDAAAVGTAQAEEAREGQAAQPAAEAAPRRVRRRDLRQQQGDAPTPPVTSDLPFWPVTQPDAEAGVARPAEGPERAEPLVPVAPPRRPERSGGSAALSQLRRLARGWWLWAGLLVAALVIGVIAAVVQQNAAEQRAIEEARRGAFDSVQVSGRLGSVPTLSLQNPVELAAAPNHRVVQAGTGRELQEGDRVVLAVTTFNGQTGKRVLEGAFPHVDVVEVNADSLGASLHGILLGQRDGARLLVLNAVEKGGQAYPELAVVDVLPRQLPVEGAGQSPSAAIEGDLKSMVSFDAHSVPQLAPWGVATQLVKVEELISGTGEQVAKGDTVVVQYVVSTWDGKVRESTYAGLGPQEVMVASLQPGLAEAVIDRAVGSRLVLAAPAALTDGNADILAVVDILAISARNQ